MACCGFQTHILKAVALVALGTGVGLVDSVRRPITLGGRITDVSIDDVIGGTNQAKPPKTQEPPPTIASSGSTAQAGTSTPPIVGDLKPGDPGWQPTPKEALPKGQITLEEAKRAFDSSASFVDARRKEEYEAGHVQGAIRMNLKSFENGNPPMMAMIPRDGVVIVYCGGGKCDESERVAEQLNNSGYAKVFIIHDGYPGWKALNLPTETGEGLQ